MLKSININKNNVTFSNDSSILIKCPRSSKYHEYSFWHSKNLVKPGKNKSSLLILYTDNFVFNLKKYGKGKYNRFKVLDESNISAIEFEEIFDIINTNIKPLTFKNPYETYRPNTIEPTKRNALEELVDE